VSVETHGPSNPKVYDTLPTRKGAVLPVLAAGAVSDTPCIFSLSFTSSGLNLAPGPQHEVAVSNMAVQYVLLSHQRHVFLGTKLHADAPVRAGFQCSQTPTCSQRTRQPASLQLVMMLSCLPRLPAAPRHITELFGHSYEIVLLPHAAHHWQRKWADSMAPEGSEGITPECAPGASAHGGPAQQPRCWRA
jgi:hypothetical protein